MTFSELATQLIAAVRTRGNDPSYVALSPDLYDQWQQEDAGREPCMISGLPICIRDNYKPKTILILGEKTEQQITDQSTLDSVMDNVERGEYGADAEAIALVRLALHDNGASEYPNARIMRDFYDSLERGRERFAHDALQVVGLDSHPHAPEIYRFAEKMAGDEGDDLIKCASILRRLAAFIHAKPH